MSAVRSAQAEVFPHNVMSSTRADAFGACPSFEKRTLPENAQRHDEDRTSSPFSRRDVPNGAGMLLRKPQIAIRPSRDPVRGVARVRKRISGQLPGWGHAPDPAGGAPGA